MTQSKNAKAKQNSQLANKLKKLQQELLDKKIRDASVELKPGEIAITKDDRNVFVAMPTPLGTITLQLNVGMFGLFAPNRGIVLQKNLVREISAVVPQDGAAVIDLSKLQQELVSDAAKPGMASESETDVQIEEEELEEVAEKEEGLQA